MAGNKGFADALTGASEAPMINARLPPRTSLLGARENRLAELTSGKSVTRVQELVEPSLCRIWERHNRDYGALNPDSCSDLIESFKAQGRQEVPAIVRRVADDPSVKYEVICGARRHWSVTWMRANGFSDFRFLVEPRELTDEEAFRVADLENRSRRDLSDFERATDYARALERYYGESQQAMAGRLDVSQSWLSRFLDLAKLPPEVLASFGSPHAVRISHSMVLAPMLRNPVSRRTILEEANAISIQQVDRQADNLAPLAPPIVLKRLVAAVKRSLPAARPKTALEHHVDGADGKVVAIGKRASRGGRIDISVPFGRRYERKALIGAFEEILEHLLSVE